MSHTLGDAMTTGPEAAGNGSTARLCLLGGFSLEAGGELIDVSPAGQRVLALLALRGRPVRRSHVAGLLWIDKSEARAGANLRSTLWRLNQGGVDLVSSRGADVTLSDEVATDHRAFSAWSDRMVRGRPHLSDLDVDLSQLSWELLPDWYDDWVEGERERLRQRWLHALESLSSELLRVRRYGRAIEAALTAVAVDPLRESAHRSVILAHLREGNLSEARRQFDSCCQRLEEDLGVAPTSALASLFGRPDTTELEPVA